MILKNLVVKHHRGMAHLVLEALPARGVIGLREAPEGFALGRLVLDALLGPEEAARFTGDGPPPVLSPVFGLQLTVEAADGTLYEVVREFERDGTPFAQVRNVTDRAILARGAAVGPTLLDKLGLDAARYLALSQPWSEGSPSPRPAGAAAAASGWLPARSTLALHRLRLEILWSTLGALARTHQAASAAAASDLTQVEAKLAAVRAQRAQLEKRRERLAHLEALLKLKQSELERELTNDLRDLDLDLEGDFVPPHGRAEQLHVVEKRLDAAERAILAAGRRLSGWAALTCVLLPVTVYEAVTYGAWRSVMDMPPRLDLLSLSLIFLTLGSLGRAWRASRDRRIARGRRDRMETSREILEEEFHQVRRAQEACASFTPASLASLHEVPELARAPGIQEALQDLERQRFGAGNEPVRLPDLTRLELEEDQLVVERDRRDRFLRELRARDVCLSLARDSLRGLSPVARLESVIGTPGPAPGEGSAVSDQVEQHLATLLGEIHRTILGLTGAERGSWWAPRATLEAGWLDELPSSAREAGRRLLSLPMVLGPDLQEGLRTLEAITREIEAQLGRGGGSDEPTTTAAESRSHWALLDEVLPEDGRDGLSRGIRQRRIQGLIDAVAALEGGDGGASPRTHLILEPFPPPRPGSSPAALRGLFEPLTRRGHQIFLGPDVSGLEMICDHMIDVSPTLPGNEVSPDAGAEARPEKDPDRRRQGGTGWA